MKKNVRNTLLVILIPILIFVCIFAVINVNKTVDKQNYSAIVEKFYANEISEFELNITSRELTYKQRSDNKTYKYTVPDSQIFYNDINEYLVEHNKTAEKKDKIEYNYLPGNEGSWIVSFLPTLLTVALIVFFFFFMF